MAMVKAFDTRPVKLNAKKSAGYCMICYAPATMEALFQVQDVIIIQKFCSTHIKEAKYLA